MPETSFKFEVATAKASAAVFADPFLSRPIAKFLRKKGLNVRLKSSAKKGPVDYVVDCFGSREAISLAQRQGSKYLRIIIGPLLSPPLEELNWRIIRTDFLVGPRMPANTFLEQLVSSAIKNEVLVLPPSGSEKVYPLATEDLVEAIWQSLVLPGTANKEFLVLGQEVEIEKISSSLQQLGQTTKGSHFSPEKKLPHYPPERIQQTNQFLKWQAASGWQELLEKTFRYFWKKIGPENPTPVIKDVIAETKLEPSLVEDSAEKKPLAPPVEPEIPETPKPVQTVKEEVPVVGKKVETPTETAKEEVIIIEEGRENFEEEEDDKAKIEGLISQFDELQAVSDEPRPIQEKVFKKKLAWWQTLILFIFLTLILETSVFFKPVGAIVLGGWHLRNAVDALKEQEWTKSQELNKKARGQFDNANHFIKNSSLKLFLFSASSQLGQIAETGGKITQAVETAIPLAENSLVLAESVLKGGKVNLKSSLEQVRSQQKQMVSQLAMTEAFLRGKWSLPLRWKGLPEKWADQIKTLNVSLAKVQEVTDHLEWIIGADGERKTFLVLLQNNMELRPTGGFIGSFAILTFENGSLANFEVKDVYTADGQLKGHVEPPIVIKEVLGEANWYLRDSNWDPDFSKSAQNAEWFLKKELGIEVDGVIGFNLEAAKKMIDAFGEVYLPDFNEKIGADNLFERVEFWTENEFFPGSTQKMAFLGLLGQQLFENMKAAEPEEYLKSVKAMLEAFDEKEILAYVHNPALTTTLHQLGWSGTLRQPNCSVGNCLTDYLYLVEANLGVNKANYFLRRSLEQTIDFKENGTVLHRLKINYENTAVSNSWPGGKYLNWLRAYLPKNTNIESVTIYDPLNPSPRETVKKDQRKEGLTNGRKVVGFQVSVPIKQRRTVEIVFSQKINTEGEQIGYLLYWQKQSGYRETPVSLLISYPNGWQPLQVNPAAETVSGKLLFNNTLTTDLNFGVEFGK